jgi:hypothetical protein
MKKLFRLFKIQRSALVKKSVSKGTLAGERPTIETETKAYLTLPMTFDFTAYFDDEEFEKNSEDISDKNSTIAANTGDFYMDDENCNEMLCLSTCRQFECCIN